jgi:multicomponent K+:H+ antiporter subunit E
MKMVLPHPLLSLLLLGLWLLLNNSLSAGQILLG